MALTTTPHPQPLASPSPSALSVQEPSGQSPNQSTFDFAPEELRGRLVKTVTLQDLSGEFQDRPDFYNPLMILITLIGALTIFSNIAGYLNAEANHPYTFEFMAFFRAISLMFVLGFIFPIIVWIFLSVVGMERTVQSFVVIVAVYNYAMLFYVMAAVLAVVPINIVKWIAFGIACAGACKFLFANYASFFSKINIEHKKPAIIMVVVLEVCTALILKGSFFSA